MYTYHIVVRHTVVREGDPLICISICIFQYVYTYHMYTHYIAFVYILYCCAAHRCRRRQLSSMYKYHAYVHILHCMCIYYIVVQRTGVGGGDHLTGIDSINMYIVCIYLKFVVRHTVVKESDHLICINIINMYIYVIICIHIRLTCGTPWLGKATVPNIHIL